MISCAGEDKHIANNDKRTAGLKVGRMTRSLESHHRSHHRLYTPYGCETAARAHTFVMECQCLYAGFALLKISFVNVNNGS